MCYKWYCSRDVNTSPPNIYNNNSIDSFQRFQKSSSLHLNLNYRHSWILKTYIHSQWMLIFKKSSISGRSHSGFFLMRESKLGHAYKFFSICSTRRWLPIPRDPHHLGNYQYRIVPNKTQIPIITIHNCLYKLLLMMVEEKGMTF